MFGHKEREKDTVTGSSTKSVSASVSEKCCALFRCHSLLSLKERYHESQSAQTLHQVKYTHIFIFNNLLPSPLYYPEIILL